jgi:hypothetical protein
LSRIVQSQAELSSFILYCQEIFNTSKKWVAEFKQYRAPKTIGQLRLLFLWYNGIATETGNDVKTIDAYFKNKYLGTEIKVFRGKEIEVLVSKADLDTKQMHYYLEAIRLEALEEMNITLPNPGDLGWEGFCAKYGIE